MFGKKYAQRTCKICGVQRPANKFKYLEIKICSKKCNKIANQGGQNQTRRTQSDSSSGSSVLGKIVAWLLSLVWIILKFIFGLIKKIFIKAADQDGDGDVDLEDVKLVLKRFTVEGRADAAERKLARAEEKRKEKEENKRHRDRLDKAKEEIEKL